MECGGKRSATPLWRSGGVNLTANHILLARKKQSKPRNLKPPEKPMDLGESRH
jgi:hypothetical protein